MAFNWGSLLGSIGQGLLGGFSGNKQQNPLAPQGFSAYGGTTPLGSQVGHGFNTGMGGSGFKQLAGKAIGQQSSQGFGGLGNIAKNPLFPGLATMVGSQLIRSPKVPDLPQSVLDFQSMAKQGNPLQNQAANALSQQLSQTKQGLGQDEIDAITRQYNLSQENELKSVDSMYKSLRPGTDPLTDTAYQKDLGRVRDRYATLRADSLAQANRQISNDFNSQRAQQIAAAAGLSNQQLSQLASLGQYDLDRQLTQLQITDRDRQTLRDYLLQFGGNLVGGAYQPQNPLLQLLGMKG